MRRFWLAVFWLTTLASAVPLLVTRFLPFADLPEHVAAIGTIARMLTGEEDAFVLDFARSQYLVYHALGGVLTLVVRDAIFANQLLLATVAVLWPLSVRSLLRATHRDERLAIFATMLFYNRALAIGFLPYLASVPIAVFALAVLARHLRAPTIRRGVALAGLAVLLFYMHVSAYVLFCAIAGTWTVLAKRNVREVARRATWLLPSALAALVWWHAGSLSHGKPMPSENEIGHMNVLRSLNALPVWTFDIWAGHRDELCAALWWLAFGIATFLGLRTRKPRRPTIRTLLPFLPFACAVAVYLATPFRVGNASMLNVRLAPIVSLFALVPLTLPRGRAAAALPLGLAAVASLATSANTTFEARRASEEMVGNFDDLLARVEPGAKVVMLNYDRLSPRTHFWPYVFAGSYHRALRGGVASWSFSELTHWPLHYAEGHAPPRHRVFWVFNPHAFRYDSDGAYYDYALVQGDEDPFTTATTGPHYARVTTSGRFTLYRKELTEPLSLGP